MKSQLRIGNGYDIHRLEPNRKLILGGVEIHYEKGLFGHSDADVLTHAIMDAMLGALALGDIGLHFPPNDPKYKDISSLELLKHVNNLINKENYTIVNIDSVIMAENPKLLPYIPAMQAKLAEILGVQVSIKATTMEGLGPIGEGRAIAASAVVLLTT
ncbi:MAG: 2-C-methyl-D-erythritol 2,4-cyclodiphosphate synthase [Candidatus Melainabacteria bacterium GWF2_37_15]|nr:MAG: 2-C-methyl-D-erythritol 2,4-cyclodiphosphate synthase [Candidatus Melainabacteria bacterium GWF2_37_15]